MCLKIISARPISKSASPFHDLLRYLNQSNRVPMGSEEVEAKPFFMMLGSWTIGGELFGLGTPLAPL